MNINQPFVQTVGIVSIVSGLIAFTSYILAAASVNFNFEFFSNPNNIFSMTGIDIMMLRWSMITDVLGYYLLLLPALFFIHDWMKEKTVWRELISFCGSTYIQINILQP